MGLKCSTCQFGNNDIDLETSSHNENSERSYEKPHSIHQMKKEQESFNNIFKTKLPELGEYYKGDFNKLIPEKIRNKITENIIDSTRYTLSTRRTFESPPIEFKNGNIYKGNWNEECEMEGEGIYYLRSENALAEGIWEKGELIGGRIFLPNDDIYEGEIQNSIFNGNGKLICNDGTIYEGNFINGEKNGIFKIYFNDGSKYFGGYYNENLNGEGEFFWNNGYYYKGNFSNGKLEGKGILKNENSKSEYNGFFSNNNFEGEGIFKWKNGTFYKGCYHLSKRNGKGFYKDNNGITYNGNWSEGKINGLGEFNNGNKIYKCFWRKGEPVEVPSMESSLSISRKISAEDLNDLFFVPLDEDIDISELNFLNRDDFDGNFEPNDNISTSTL